MSARRTTSRIAIFAVAALALVGATVSTPVAATGIVQTGGAGVYAVHIFGQVFVFSPILQQGGGGIL